MNPELRLTDGLTNQYWKAASRSKKMFGTNLITSLRTLSEGPHCYVLKFADKPLLWSKPCHFFCDSKSRLLLDFLQKREKGKTRYALGTMCRGVLRHIFCLDSYGKTCLRKVQLSRLMSTSVQASPLTYTRLFECCTFFVKTHFIRTTRLRLTYIWRDILRSG